MLWYERAFTREKSKCMILVGEKSFNHPFYGRIKARIFKDKEDGLDVFRIKTFSDGTEKIIISPDMRVELIRIK